MKAGELRKILELVKPGLSKNEILPQSSSIAFTGGYAITFNDEVAVRAACPWKIEGAVAAEPLYAFLGRISPDADFEAKADGDALKLKAGRNRASVPLTTTIKLPVEEELQEPKKWYPLPDGFVNAVRQVLFSASTAKNMPILTCIHLAREHAETCDKYRLTRCSFTASLTGAPDSGTAIIARHLERLGDYNPTHYGYAGAWLHFKREGGASYCVRTVPAEYPDLEGFMDVKGEALEFPKGIKDALDWASILMPNEKDKYRANVQVTIADGLITVRGEKGPNEWAEASERIRYTGDPLGPFEVHPLFLADMAKLAQTVTVGADALKIEGENFIHIIALGNE